MSKNLTISELHKILTELIDDGYGDREFRLYHDTDCIYSYIEKGSPISLINNAVEFKDHN